MIQMKSFDVYVLFTKCEPFNGQLKFDLDGDGVDEFYSSIRIRILRTGVYVRRIQYCFGLFMGSRHSDDECVHAFADRIPLVDAVPSSKRRTVTDGLYEVLELLR